MVCRAFVFTALLKSILYTGEQFFNARLHNEKIGRDGLDADTAFCVGSSSPNLFTGKC
jgi:hypothetical protein